MLSVKNNLYSLPEAKAVMAQRIRVVFDAPFPTAGECVRLELPVQPVDPLLWLAAVAGSEKFYWADREGGEVTAGTGCARIVQLTRDPQSVSAAVQALLSSGSGARAWGGLCFDPQRIDEPWAGFGCGRLVIPRFELTVKGRSATLACMVEPGAVLPDILNELAVLPDSTPPISEDLPAIISRRDSDTQALWCGQTRTLIEALQRGEYRKVVLARCREVAFAQTLNPFAVLARLRRAAAGCYLFLFQTGADVFLGASPERLYRRQGREISTEAVAGTCPRGMTPEEDQRLGQQLRDSAKDLLEHRYVVDELERGLGALSGSVAKDHAPQLLSLSGGYHLITRLRGVLKGDKGDADLLKTLHPTPAMAGLPTKKALEVIRLTEKFARGWYAGPVGFLGAEASEFAVGIRCGLIRGKVLNLFAGAGVVALSDAESEWQEIEHKLGNIMRVVQ